MANTINCSFCGAPMEANRIGEHWQWEECADNLLLQVAKLTAELEALKEAHRDKHALNKRIAELEERNVKFIREIATFHNVLSGCGYEIRPEYRGSQATVLVLVGNNVIHYPDPLIFQEETTCNQ
jgi:hypothetical protein